MRMTIKGPLLGAFAWSAINTLSVIVSLAMQGRGFASNTDKLVLIFGLGSLLAYPLARALLYFMPDKWQTTQRFAAAFIVLCGATVGVTAMLFAYQFQEYYSQWHDDHLSKRLLFETVFTILSACYQFLVLALRNYFPIGLIGLLVASWLFAMKRI
jgi:hypothetical protein